MKLPGIKYGTPVQSLGRQDITVPVGLAQSQSFALHEASKLVEKIEANEVASSAAGFQTEMAEMNANMMNRKSFSIDELDELEVRYNDRKYGLDKFQEVPSYLVSKQVYNKLSKRIYDKHITGAGKRGKAIISKMYGSMYKSGISSVIKQSMTEAHSVRSTVVEMDFDNAVKSGNETAATIIAETAKATGVWNSEKHLSKTWDMPDKIAQSDYLNNLNRLEDPLLLEENLSGLLVDPDLKPGSKNSLYRRYETKIRELEKQEDKMTKEAKKKVSYDDFIITSTDIVASGESMPWDEIADIAMGMEPSDGKGLVTLNRIMGEKGVVTDPKTHMLLSVKIKSLSLPREGTNIYQRRQSIVDDLIRASGYDPVTKESLGPSKISPDDFISLWNDINKSQAFVYDNPEVKRVVDQVWLSLTGASKDMISSIMGEGPNVINAVQAERDILEKSRAIGPGFNPDAWWKENGSIYFTSALEDNLQTLKENRLDKYIVSNPSMPGFIDIGKTIQGISDRIKVNSLTQENADKIMKDINDIYRLRIERMKLTETE